MLIAILEFHLFQKKRFDNIVTNLVFHGGEPLAQSFEYLESLLLAIDQILGVYTKDGSIKLGLQTNLFRPSEKKLDLLKLYDVRLGVSFDLVPGVRLSSKGDETEVAVRRNIENLMRRGFQISAITVLALHTHKHLRTIHDFFASHRISWRVLPLFDGPDSRPLGSVQLSNDAIIEALEDLFLYWFEEGRRIPIEPFNEHFENVLRKMVGIRGTQYTRRDEYEGVFVVDHSGSLFRVVDGYNPELCLGNVSRSSINDILASQAYAASLQRDDRELEQYCSQCEYEGACNGWPIFATRQPGTFNGRCPLSYRLHLFMERYLRNHGFGEAELSTMAHSLLSQSRVAQSVDLAVDTPPSKPVN